MSNAAILSRRYPYTSLDPGRQQCLFLPCGTDINSASMARAPTEEEVTEPPQLSRPNDRETTEGVDRDGTSKEWAATPRRQNRDMWRGVTAGVLVGMGVVVAAAATLRSCQQQHEARLVFQGYGLAIAFQDIDCVRLGDKIKDAIGNCPRISLKHGESLVEDTYSSWITTPYLRGSFSVVVDGSRVKELTLSGHARHDQLKLLIMETVDQLGVDQKRDCENWIQQKSDRRWECIVGGVKCSAFIKWEDQPKLEFELRLESL
jgi:hypothetical protein